jgi:hypothetical protein
VYFDELIITSTDTKLPGPLAVKNTKTLIWKAYYRLLKMLRSHWFVTGSHIPRSILNANRFCFIAGVNSCFMIGLLAFRPTSRSLRRTDEASISTLDVSKLL